MLSLRGFEILETLPKGGMSTVYKARQISLDRLVAIKVLPPTMGVDPADIEKFMAEARITASLKHANIVQVYDFGQSEEGVYYIVMEYISGYTVASWIRRKRCLSEENALLCALNVALAMNYAWQKAGIVHCDIKPDNVIIDGDGTVKLADLGLARSVKSIVAQAQAEERLIFGTPNYISPEQSSGVEPLDCRADIYSLGAMLYHCLTGTMPFEGRPPLEVMDLQISDQIPDPQDINPQVSVWAACLIEKMMAKDRSFRPKDWDQLIKDIANVRSEMMPQDCLPPEAASTVKRSPLRETRLQEVLRTPETEKKEPAPLPAPDEASIKIKRQAARLWKKSLLAGAVAALAFAAAWALWAFFGSPKTESVQTAKIPEIMPLESAQQELAAQTGETHRTKNADLTRSAAQKTERIIKETRAILAQLDKKTAPLAAHNRFAEAAAVYEKYRGAFENETAAERQKKAQALRARQAALANERQQQKKQAEFQLRHAAEEIAAIIVEDSLTEARTRLAELSDDLPLIARRPEFKNLAGTLEKADGAEQRIVDSFRRQKNQDATVSFVTGPTNVFIRDVQGDMVVAEKTVVLDQGTLSIQKNFKAKDLTLDEKLARLGDKPDPEIALLRTLLALEGGDCRQALVAAAQTGPLLSAPLAATVKKAGEQRAVQALASVLRRAGVGDSHVIPAPDLCRQALRGKNFSYKKSQELNRGVAQFRTRFGFTDIARRYDGALAALTNADARLRGTTSLLPPEAAQALAPPMQTGHKPGELIISKIMEANNGLREDEIILKRDHVGRIRAIEIVSSQLRDLTPLENLITMQKLVCAGMRDNVWVATPIIAPLDDLTPLKKIPLKELILNHTRVKDLAPLSQMPLVSLNLARTKVNDLQPLKGLPLRHLDLSFTAVNDITPLRNMPLEYLNLANTRIRDISALNGLPLTTLEISNNNINDITALQGMDLTFLNLSNTRVKDLSALAGMRLQFLDLDKSGVKDIAVLKNMPLKTLRLRETEVADLTPVEDSGIEDIWVDDLRDQTNREKSRLILEVLYKMPKLKMINGQPLWMFRTSNWTNR